MTMIEPLLRLFSNEALMDENRRITLGDEKAQIIDWENSNLIPPDVGIYDGEVRWYKANKHWATIIEGHLLTLASLAAWKDAQNENFHAIQQIYTFIEGVEPMSLDFEAMKQAVCEGVVCGVNEVAVQLIAGQQSNRAPGGGIIIDNDSNDATVKPPSGFVDDPTTTSDNAAHSGGATAIRIGINAIWSQLNAWYTAVPQVSVAVAKERITKIYDLNQTEIDALIDKYYTDRTASSPYVSSFASTLDGYLYCKGLNIETIFEWIFEIHTANQRDMAALLPPALTERQIQLWYNQGSQVPSYDYVAYSCVPIDPETFIMNAAYLPTGSYKTGAQIGKLNHRIKIHAEGKVFHPSDGSYQDFFYHVAADGTKTFIGTSGSLGTLQFNDTFGNPPQTKVPWKASGVYDVTMETIAAEDYRFRRVITADRIAAGSAGFTVTLTDLGEVVN